MTRLFLIGVAAAFAFSDPAAAASLDTYVSRLGVDSGSCTRSAPCNTFQYALGQTSAGGVVSALVPGGYGPVSITQSVTIAGPGKGRASITPRNGAAGIDVQAPGATVVLRGLEIDGGVNGINVGQAATVVISDTVIVGSSSLAINASDTGARVLVQDTTVQGGEVDTNAAIFVAKRLKVSGSPGFGVNPLAGIAVLDDCTVSGSGSVNVPVYGSTAIIKNCALPNAGLRGIDVTNGAVAYIDSTTTFGNGQFGIIVAGTAYSYGNNNFSETTSGAITPIAGD